VELFKFLDVLTVKLGVDPCRFIAMKVVHGGRVKREREKEGRGERREDKEGRKD
jgi:hypothetical protein